MNPTLDGNGTGVSRCELCIDGIAYASDRAVCDRCFDEVFESARDGVIVAPIGADPSLDDEVFHLARDTYYATKRRVDDWWARNEEYRHAGVKPDLEHRFESAVCRALWRLLDVGSGVPLDEMVDLIRQIEEEQARAEFSCGYRMTSRTLHSFHVRAGRLLKQALPAADDKLYRLESDFDEDTFSHSYSSYDVYEG